MAIIGGGLLTMGAVKVFKKVNKVEQKGNTVGGDMAGRDIKKK